MSAYVAGATSPSQFILRCGRYFFECVDSFGWKGGQCAFHFAPDTANSYTEHTLSALYQVDDLIRGGALVH
jgi:hypothetical protein